MLTYLYVMAQHITLINHTHCARLRPSTMNARPYAYIHINTYYIDSFISIGPLSIHPIEHRNCPSNNHTTTNTRNKRFTRRSPSAICAIIIIICSLTVFECASNQISHITHTHHTPYSAIIRPMSASAEGI